MEPSVEPIGPPVSGMGKGLFWDDESQTLFYIDVVTPKIYHYNPKTGEHHSVDLEMQEPHISMIVKVKGEKNKFVISNKKRLATVSWDGVSSKPLTLEHLVDVEDKESTANLNEGKCDPSYRLWIGSIGPCIGGDFNDVEHYAKEKGSMYSLRKDNTVEKHFSKVGISHGLAWSLDKKTLYHADTRTYAINSYDNDDSTGAVKNQNTVFCYKKNKVEGGPKGMAIDQEGMLWVASFGAGEVIRIDPKTGKLLRTLKMPSPQIVSVLFGGPTLEDLYVTSGKFLFTKEMEEKYPHGGCTFRVTGLGVKGTPCLPVQLPGGAACAANASCGIRGSRPS